MHALLESARDRIAVVCRRMGVKRLEVFGSILRDDFDATISDIDVVVEFDPNAPGSALRRYFDLKAQLEELLGRPVDVIELDAMQDSRLKRLIERTKVPIYAAHA
jgi:predicted nucleotidyltransferase